ncbi:MULTISPECIES: TetR/AcrR family transcriptional regulator [unclassified Kitasatospora]|uniref:TetR/AcrR family transcriptional regulator n=1 Tax=unclassified Kitasatospora TaxID=2633591 RepID=UPI00070B6BE4|nr:MULTISPECIES: TetR/AcrR family transcriptional regulator C-terminal domain-containing protein [unclassified Kitasatospora]KQV15384.1 TetR family transcriptional regulator [Kitasatospora sp. Root107]KRB64027.1 TetR family transcriptional regulator [Kitasatospora sp. Root187]
MAKDRSSAGDPSRTLALLWREPGGPPVGGRGPRQGLSVDAVVQAALELADTDGLEAVSMRRVAQQLGVTPMTLYTYVPGKAELLDLMLDTLFQRMPRPVHTDAPWRERVTAVAEANRALYLAHPWVAALPATRPPLGPGLITKYEHELSAFDGLGLPDLDIDAALTHLLGFVRSTARTALETQAAAADSAISDADWWEANAPILAKVFDPERFPLATRIGTAAGEAHQSAYSADHAYEFGLRRVLDGFAALIAERAAGK